MTYEGQDRRGKNPSKVQAAEDIAHGREGADSLAEIKKVKSCNYWHPPVRRSYKSETRYKNGKRCHLTHVEPVRKDQLLFLKVVSKYMQPGCVSQDFHPRKSILRKE